MSETSLIACRMQTGLIADLIEHIMFVTENDPHCVFVLLHVSYHCEMVGRPVWGTWLTWKCGKIR